MLDVGLVWFAALTHPTKYLVIDCIGAGCLDGGQTLACPCSRIEASSILTPNIGEVQAAKSSAKILASHLLVWSYPAKTKRALSTGSKSLVVPIVEPVPFLCGQFIGHCSGEIKPSIIVYLPILWSNTRALDDAMPNCRSICILGRVHVATRPFLF